LESGGLDLSGRSVRTVRRNLLPQIYTLKIKAVYYSETLVPMYQTTRCQNTENHIMNQLSECSAICTRSRKEFMSPLFMLQEPSNSRSALTALPPALWRPQTPLEVVPTRSPTSTPAPSLWTASPLAPTVAPVALGRIHPAHFHQL
jgi:hypothetical protein